MADKWSAEEAQAFLDDVFAPVDQGHGPEGRRGDGDRA